jgi:hypothetical protein
MASSLMRQLYAGRPAGTLRAASVLVKSAPGGFVLLRRVLTDKQHINKSPVSTGPFVI